jgi:hypothetical protein
MFGSLLARRIVRIPRSTETEDVEEFGGCTDTEDDTTDYTAMDDTATDDTATEDNGGPTIEPDRRERLALLVCGS